MCLRVVSDPEREAEHPRNAGIIDEQNLLNTVIMWTEVMAAREGNLKHEDVCVFVMIKALSTVLTEGRY